MDRGTMYRDVMLVSVPVLSPTWELLLILTAAGHPRDLDNLLARMHNAILGSVIWRGGIEGANDVLASETHPGRPRWLPHHALPHVMEGSELDSRAAAALSYSPRS